MNRKKLIYPIPLNVPVLPAVIKMPGLLSPKLCKEILETAEKKGYTVIGQDRFGGKSTTKSLDLLPEDNQEVYDIFVKMATKINEEQWRLNLTGVFEPMRMLKYQVGAWIRPHIDADYRVPDPSKLTCTMQLVPKDNYTGGIMTVAETEDFELDLGDAIIFPSHMLHTVSPVESGERIVVSAWVHGSTFQ